MGSIPAEGEEQKPVSRSAPDPYGDHAAPSAGGRRQQLPPWGRHLIPDAWGGLLIVTVLLHVINTPFTKVEESFNVQAMHDLLYHRQRISEYDHLEFPGVVPRTFLGAILVAGLSAPAVAGARLLGFSKLSGLYIIRSVLGCSVAAALLVLRSAVERVLGRPVGVAFVVLTSTQFHLPFYASRPLANTIALVPTAVALAAMFARSRPRVATALLTFTTAVLRCDIVLLLAPVGLQLVLDRQIGLLDGVATGLLAAAASAAASLAVDSVFWQRWIWPELHVLMFNTVQNRSSEWGVQPAYWYFTSALPKALLAAFPLAAAGALWERRVRPSVVIGLTYVCIYSILPHKEVRFIFPALLLFNVAAAAALARLHQRRGKGMRQRLAWQAAVGLLAVSAAASAGMAAVSRRNYPGGHALNRLHAIVDAAPEGAFDPTPVVHVGVLPAQTGVSRFHERGPPWQYCKVEGLTDSQLGNNTFLLSAQREVVGFDLLDFEPGFPRVAITAGFGDAVARARSGKLPVWIRTVPTVFIHAFSPPHRTPPLQQVLSLVSNSRVGKWIHALGNAVAP